MSLHEEEPRQRGMSPAKASSLQEKVAQFYYSQGLFCSTYPATVVSLAIGIALLCCLPLVNLPLPGNAPHQTWTSSVNLSNNVGGNGAGQPFCYIQQVVIRIAVMPWESDLTLGDAFRGPIYESFKLLEVIRNYQDTKSSKTLGHVCLHVEAIRNKEASYRGVLPEYSCLVLSPANLWQQDVQRFAEDSSLLTTIFNQHSFQKGKISITEMLFGMHVFDTGIKRYPLRNRQRVIQYAVSLFFKEYDVEFINGLKQKLQSIYQLHQNVTMTFDDDDDDDNINNNNLLMNDTVLIQYPGEINYIEFVPITLAFVLLFFYYYFTVRKMELIKSKFGMAFAAIVTVLGSFTMTLGLCFFFGLTLNLEGKEVFPYLVLLVGLENVLVLTKSVISTPLHLDIKIRIAQGLSKEGWSITKNLLLELTILTFGLFTFVPAIQEFCIFAIVGLITDYFLQMFFFATILGIDIRRMENLVEKTNSSAFRTSLLLYQTHVFNQNKIGMIRSKSYPRLSTFPANIVAGQAHTAQEKKIPKRLRLINIWTRTRFFQRAFMILMVTWICSIAYNSGIIEHYIILNNNSNNNVEEEQEKLSIRTNNDQQQLLLEQNYSSIKLFPLLDTINKVNVTNYVTTHPNNNNSPFDTREYQQNHTDDLEKLKHTSYAPWLKLSLQHWPCILRKYNLTLSGQYVAVLPNIQISHVITPEQVVVLRHPDESYGEKFQWQALAAALDPLDFNANNKGTIPQSERPFYPTSVLEIGLTTILCLISIIVLAYTFVVLYRCICSRNYAEWRASWFNERSTSDEQSDDQVLLEAVPVVLNGHEHDIECIATDGTSLVSGCLGGQLKVWDTSTGELMANIDRKLYFCGDDDLQQQQQHQQQRLLHQSGNSNAISVDYEDYNSSDYESGSPPSRDEILFMPRLKRRINTNFSSTTNKSVINANCYDSKSEFNNSYSQLYFNYDPLSSSSLSLSHGLCLKSTLSDSVHNANVISESTSLYYDDNNFSDNKQMILNRELSDSGNIIINNNNKLSPIWCMDYLDNLIVVGCADGRLEFWEGTTGKLKCLFEDGTNIGISNIKLIGSRVIASRLYGTLDLFHLQTYSQGRPVDWNFTSAYRRTHMRTGSVDSLTVTHCLINNNQQTNNYCEEDLRCIKLLSLKAHQQPITCMDCEGGRLLTGSQDHTLKVFRIEDGSLLYTLHGHCGPITCLFIDRVSPAMSGSGSQDGMLCVWDLLTGTCMYNIQAHDGIITSLTYSASYVISLGSDDRLCVWERFQGHLLNAIYVSQTFASQVLMLAPHLVITARSGDLVVWDVRTGDCVRTITLGRAPFVFIKQLILLRDAVLCDYGNQLRIVRFPMVNHKFD